ncbi:hypothetical protein TPADAL_0825 [Treponema pallidum subsp. pallidum DAL-1]|uniref:Uncharacterized protein n=2 Tax=Treponema pallidum TaxID=160 RepID=A0AAU8S262_TREPL|nr:hypothetical protein TPESAMD_0825 [Treponema pallidum subsp. pertenue str. SamoaD]AEZ59026.1 hypothetical protein TPECDC2_0825 [Treponema pallidum subsp. pertenue str. CDC2]AEZ60094.1 hypothetical protein TPEGAU_0825 [Treponema pallidum subsp. pertenue str. Gauthier]AEZ61154.1 hypothetical protein TPADAL_0825 [Treponema pallidum subsp. pallidum DAL-1]AGK84478.1 hypothetical protein TPFB_0825 [Treponema pallidum str. Fribourg-Blanc]AJB40854.1 hypothetical protein TENDBA_0825 [Treponema palli
MAVSPFSWADSVNSMHLHAVRYIRVRLQRMRQMAAIQRKERGGPACSRQAPGDRIRFNRRTRCLESEHRAIS